MPHFCWRFYVSYEFLHMILKEKKMLPNAISNQAFENALGMS